MELQGIMNYDQGEKRERFSSIHRRRASLDGDRHMVAVNTPIQELPEKIDKRIRPNHNSNYEEEDQQQQTKSVWDCESSLYDSFELYTFSRQLNRAIAAASTPSSLLNNHQLIGGVRSWSMPHHSSTKTRTTQCQCSPLNVEEEEIKVQEEKLRSQVIKGGTHQINIHTRHKTVAVQSKVDRQQDRREILKTHSRRLGFPRSVQKVLMRLFHIKAGSCKPKNTMETEADEPYCYKSVYPEQQEERCNHNSQGFSIHRSEFDSKVRKTASERVTQESLGSLMRRQTVGY